MIRVDAIWMSTAPCDMRSGMDTLMNQIIAVFGAAQAHNAYLCVFWLKLDKVSRRNWTRIPFEPGHGFWLKLDKDSSANWTHQIARG
ncbi:hypothetical protein, partial [uncultured Limnobacter sp.]|uniref:hypothetical protein n=1 Tax=uncultured Limnobacter sp. TaxID=199681 RepID=UPI00260D5C1D